MLESVDWALTKQSVRPTVRFADGEADMSRIRELRARLFGITPSVSAYVSRLDDMCEHLMLEAGVELVGCCRLANSGRATDFDSSDSFDISKILGRPGTKLELSYTCVTEDRRQGPVIRLLLRAIRDYCRENDVATIFGCASLSTTDVRVANETYRELKNPDGPLRNGSPLLRFYQSVGAEVLGAPSFDPAFRCFDFLMAFDFASAPEQVLKRIARLG